MSLQQFLKEDRQWKRPLRIAHAQYQVSVAKTEKERQFWQQVVEANSSESRGSQ